MGSVGPICALAIVGLLTYHRWLTDRPLSAGDWYWVSRNQLRTWFPWPSVWEPTTGFGIKNFSGVYEFPIQALAGTMSQLGADWQLIEKVTYFLPFAALSFVSPWVFGREILKDSRWAVVSAVIFAANTYFLTFSVNGQMFLGVAEVLSPIVITGFMRTIRLSSVRWALLTALLLFLQSAYELRITYLTVLLCVLYLLLVVLVTDQWRTAIKRIGLALVCFITFGITQAYWLVPLLGYREDPGLPISAAPWLSFMSLSHGITAVSPYWTGGLPAFFHMLTVPGIFFLLPLIAFIPLTWRNRDIDALWLSIAGLTAAFLIKQNSAPWGQIYDWLYSHAPGWTLFREGSKFYFVVAMAYSVLIPLALRSLFDSAHQRRSFRLSKRLLGAVGLVGVLLLSFGTLQPLIAGDLGLTTDPIYRPASFVSLSSILDSDAHDGTVLWFGGASVKHAGESFGRWFPLKSERHPLLELTGNLDPGDNPQPYAADPLAPFCRAPQIPFCYVDPELFPYLLNRLSASYVVAPAGEAVGNLPTLSFSTQPVLNYRTLLNRLTSTLGPPTVVGTGATALAMWVWHPTAHSVVSAKAIVTVDGPEGSTLAALPALDMLGLPAVYRWNDLTAPSDRNLPSSIDVLPPSSQRYRVGTAGQFVVMAKSAEPSLIITDGSSQVSIGRRSTTGTPAGWSVYGPLDLQAGDHRLTASDDTVLGPCMTWSTLTEGLMNDVSRIAYPQTTAVDAEAVTSFPASGPWYELKRAFDPGWRLSGAAAPQVGDGLFNLYYAPQAAGPLAFGFSSQPWEGVGIFISLASVLAAVALVFLAGRRALASPPPRELLKMRSTGRYFATTGIVLVVIAFFFGTLASTGIFSRAAWLVQWTGHSAESDPYGASEFYATWAAAALAIAMALDLIVLVSRPATKLAGRWRRAPALAVLISSLALGACAPFTQPSPQQVDALLASAIQAADLGECVSRYTMVLEARPTSVPAYLGRAQCYSDEGRPMPAIQDYKQAISLGLGNPDVYSSLANAEFDVGDTRAALTDFNRAGRMTSASGRQILEAAEGLAAAGSYPEALSLLDYGLARFNSFWELHKYRAEVESVLGNDAAARSEYSTALELSVIKADVAWVLEGRAGFYLERQQFGLAEKDYGNALQLVEGNYHLFEGRARARQAAGDLTGAMADYNAAIGIVMPANPNARSEVGSALMEERGRLFLLQGYFQAARNDFVEALRVTPPTHGPRIAMLQRLTATVAH